MRECWNCAAAQPDTHRFCARCGQPLTPTPAEQAHLLVALRFLLRESERWGWMPPGPRAALQEEYTRRLSRLKAGPRTLPAPAEVVSTPVPRPPIPAPMPPVAAPPERAPAPPNLFSAFLEEANIRWLLILGGLLLASAGIGLLYSQWSAHGRQIVGVVLLLAPLICLAAAIKLRPTLPVSSRILAAVGGLLLPTGLIAARLFELGGLTLPWPHWNLFAFSLSAVVLLVLAGVLEETLCLYLGTLATVGAAGALADTLAWPPAFGLASLALATVHVARSRRQDAFAPHHFGLGQALAALGLMSTLPHFVSPGSGPPIPALALLFLGALFFSGSGYLVGRPGAVLASAPVALAAIGLFIAVYDLPAVTAGFGVLALGAGYLGGARALRQQPEVPEGPQLAELSFQLGTVLTGLALLLLLGTQALHGLSDDYARVPATELQMGAIVALIAAGLYVATAFLFEAPAMMYAATLCVTWSWFLGSVLLHRGAPGLYPGDLSLLALLAVAAAWPLRGLVRDPYLRPLVESSLLLASLPGPLALLLRGLGARGAEEATPWTLAVVAATFLLATPWLRAGWPLYFAAGWGAAAYATALPMLLAALGYPTEPLNLGLAFLPLLGGLAVIAFRLEVSAGAGYSLPVARITLGTALLLSLAQLPPGTDPRGTAALTLALYALAFALVAPFARRWGFLETSAGDLLAHLSALNLAAALWVGFGDGSEGSHLALLALSAAALAGAPMLPSMAGRALAHAGLACAALVALAGPAATDTLWIHTTFAWSPALLWLFRLRTHPPSEQHAPLAVTCLGLAAGAVGLVGAGLPLEGEPALTLVLMVGALWGLAGPARTLQWPLLPAWAVACLGWSALLDLLGRSGDDRVTGWWMFCALAAVGLTAVRRREATLAAWGEALLVITTGLVLGRAAFASPSHFLGTDLLLAAALLTVGWRRPSSGYFLIGWGLLTLAPLHFEFALADDGPILARAAALLALATSAAAAASRFAQRPDRPSLTAALVLAARSTTLLAMLLALPPYGPDWTWNVVGFLALAGAQGALALTLGRTADWHLAGLGLYGAWGHVLHHHEITTTEAWLVPPALWMLFWGERYRSRSRLHSDALATVGALLLLAPSLLQSTGTHGTGHLVFLVAASLALLLYGIGRRQRVHAVAGSVALLLEMALQALRLAVLVPWWYVALASGLLLVGLGILFERRRRDILAAGQHILSEVAGW